INAKAISNIIIKGNEARITEVMGTFAIDEVINKCNPTGGVTKPIIKLTVIIIEKWIGSIPKPVKIGNIIGTDNKITGIASITIPSKRSKILTTIKITYGLSLNPLKKDSIAISIS